MKSNSMAMMFTLLMAVSCKTTSKTGAEQKSIDTSRTVCVKNNMQKDNPLFVMLEQSGSPMYRKFGSFNGLCDFNQSGYLMVFSDNLVKEFLKTKGCRIYNLSAADREIIVIDKSNGGGIAAKGAIDADYCEAQTIFKAIHSLPELK